ncbi:MAG: hypothetical protein PVI22_17260, partial [Lysobacterales bacterium]
MLNPQTRTFLLAVGCVFSLLAYGQERPVFEISTDKAYDPGQVPAYAGDHQAIYSHIDEQLPYH